METPAGHFAPPASDTRVARRSRCQLDRVDHRCLRGEVGRRRAWVVERVDHEPLPTYVDDIDVEQLPGSPTPGLPSIRIDREVERGRVTRPRRERDVHDLARVSIDGDVG